MSSCTGRRARRVTIIMLALLLLGATTTAVVRALWSSSGTGPASTRAVTAQAITITAASNPTAELYPGATGGLHLSISNPNPYAVSLTSADYGSVTSSDPTNCPASNLTVAADGALSAPIAVPAGASSQPASIGSAVTLATSAPDGCQGVTFTVSVTLTGTQV